MGTVAYLRLSTSGQDLHTQRFAILDYAQQHGLVIDTFMVTLFSLFAEIQGAIDAVATLDLR